MRATPLIALLLAIAIIQCPWLLVVPALGVLFIVAGAWAI